MINSENAMLRGSVLFNVRDRDLGSTVKEAQDKLNAMMTKMPKGYYVEWRAMGNQIRANKNISPWLYYNILILYSYNSMKEAFVTIITVPLRYWRDFMVYFMALIYLSQLQLDLLLCLV
jgi:Cu(I)/Ag(I) efflux system membrane protein CusA/SilA